MKGPQSLPLNFAATGGLGTRPLRQAFSTGPHVPVTTTLSPASLVQPPIRQWWGLCLLGPERPVRVM